jgi:hypothetical protein
LLLTSLLLLPAGCNPLGFDAVSISPIYGWVDGCNTVTIGGHGFDEKVTAKIGDNALNDIQQPTRDLDKGYLFTGVVPPASEAGYHDVVVTDGQNSDTITGSGAYYYVACPAPGTVDAVSPTEGITAGATVAITGCGLDPAAVRGRLVSADGTFEGDAFDLTSTCGTASVTFTAPDVADGVWYLELIDSTGAVLNGAPCPPPDTADTAAPACTDYPLTYGSAR